VLIHELQQQLFFADFHCARIFCLDFAGLLYHYGQGDSGRAQSCLVVNCKKHLQDAIAQTTSHSVQNADEATTKIESSLRTKTTWS
jgi:hypothetical protein